LAFVKRKQDPNAGNSGVTVIYRVPKTVGVKSDFRHFHSSKKQHVDDGCVRLARYDFLLVFHGDLKYK